MSATLRWLEPGFGDVMAARLVLPLGSAADPPGKPDCTSSWLDP